MNSLRIVSIIIFLTLFNTGCSTVNIQYRVNKENQFLSINKALFDASTINVTQPDQVFYLSEVQKQEFLNFYHQELANGVKPHKALLVFLEDRLSNFTYYGSTFVAEKAMRLNKGNCMSLAILTTALAQVVNLEVDYREVNTLPVFEKHKNLILSASHVQAVIYDPDFVEEEGTFYFRRPAVVIDYFPQSSNRVSTKILKDSLLAKYYINVASTALVDGQLDRAFAYAEYGFKFDKSTAQMANLLAVLHRRAGDEKNAELFYSKAIEYDTENLVLLTNYAVLLKKQNRLQELEFLNQKIDTLEDPNPYSWLEQAYMAQSGSQFRKAEKYYLKVIEMAPYVHQAYLGLYQVYRNTNQTRRAKHILKEGLKWTYEVKERNRYKGKLYSVVKA